MYCIWLTFDSQDLFNTIFKLARKYNSPVFQPHCTLIGKTNISIPRLKSSLTNLGINNKSINIHPFKINYSDNYWRALYIDLKEKQLIKKWHKQICDLLVINNDKDFFPHISLMYNSISLREKKRISEKIKLKSAYKIESIQIINCNGNVDEWKPIFELSI